MLNKYIEGIFEVFVKLPLVMMALDGLGLVWTGSFLGHQAIKLKQKRKKYHFFEFSLSDCTA